MENIYIIRDVAARWEKLGIALRFSDAQLSVIERDCRERVEDCSEAVLRQWLQGCADENWEPKTWDILLLAMVKAQCTEVAQKVRKALTGEGKHYP